jgi:hypothetical protein
MSRTSAGKFNGNDPGFDALLSSIRDQVGGEFKAGIFSGDILVSVGVILCEKTHQLHPGNWAVATCG